MIRSSVSTICFLMLVACAGPSHIDRTDWERSPIVSAKDVSGEWEGLLMSVNARGDWVGLHIGEEGAYEFATYRLIGVLQGKGTFSVHDGKLIAHPPSDPITCALYTVKNQRMLKAEGTDKKGVVYTADLFPAKR